MFGGKARGKGMETIQQDAPKDLSMHGVHSRKKRALPTDMSVSAMARPIASAAVYPIGGHGAHVHSFKKGRAQKKGRLWQTTMAGLLSSARFLAASSWSKSARGMASSYL